MEEKDFTVTMFHKRKLTKSKDGNFFLNLKCTDSDRILKCLVDTGAAGSAIKRSTYEELMTAGIGEYVRHSMTAYGATGFEKIEDAIRITFNWGPEGPTVSLTFNAISMEHIDVDCLLGCDIMEQAGVILDFGEATMTLVHRE